MQQHIFVTAGLIVLSAGMAAALTDTQKCEVTKINASGKFAFCRQKAETKSIKTGAPVDYAKCDATFSNKWATAENKGGPSCPTTGDAAQIQNKITADTSAIALTLVGTRFVDNGDGTVSDLLTGLMWEQKTNFDGVIVPPDPHDADNGYTWSSFLFGTVPDGTVFTDFLASKLNACQSADGITVTGGFAGHCDWRLPSLPELQTILLSSPCSPGFCIDPIFGPTAQNYYWTSTTWSPAPAAAWLVGFSSGDIFGPQGKNNVVKVRAVRGGL